MICEINVRGQIIDSEFESKAEYNQETVVLADLIAQYKEGAKEVVFKIDSGGGSVWEGFKIKQWIESLSQKTVALLVGDCYSMATVIALSCQERTALPEAKFMIHNPFASELPCTRLKCDAERLQEWAEELRELETEMRFFYVQKSGLPIERIDALMKEEKFLSASEAKQLNFIHSIQKPMKQSSLFNTILSAIKGFFTAKGININALELTLDNGEMLYVETADGEIEGKPVFSVATGEPAPNRVLKLQDGREITVENGIITSVSEVNAEMPEMPEEEEMNAEQPAPAQASTDAHIQKLIEMAMKAENFNNRKENKIIVPPTAQPTMQVLASKHKALGGFTDAGKHQTGWDAFARNIRRTDGNTRLVADVLQTEFNYVYDGILTTEVFLKPVLETPDIKRLFRVMPNIRFKKHLNLIGAYGKMIKEAQGCGTPAPTGDPIDITNRTLETTKLEIYLEQCVETFWDTIMEEATNRGLNLYDLQGSQMESIIMDVVNRYAAKNLFELFSFGDTGSANAYYSPLNGLWTRLLDNSGLTDSYCVKRFPITALTDSGSTRAYDWLKQAYETANPLLKQQGNKRFFVTQNLYESYMTFLENTSGVQGAWVQLQGGVSTLSFRGIPVIPVLSWDEELANPNNPLFGTYNTLLLYTDPVNHVIGVDEPRLQQGIEMWYDRNERVNKINSNFSMGYNYVHCDLQVIGVGNV